MIALVLLVAVALVLAGFYLWARSRGLVAPAGSARDHRTRVSLLTEAVAYVGAILVLAGGIAAVGQRWHEISTWGHVGVFAGAGALFLAAGVLLLRVPEDAIQRLVSALWFLSAGGVIGAVAYGTRDLLDQSVGVSVLAVGLVTAGYSAVLWLVRPRPLQNLALFVALIVTVCGVIAVAADDPTPLEFSLPLWALGLVWALLGWQRRAEPLWMSIPLGVLLALAAPSFAVADHGWMLAVAIATSAGMMATSIPARNTVLLALGTVATFGYLTAAVLRYLRDTLGVPAALTVTGLLILVLAVVSARLMRAVHPPTDQPADDRDLHKVS